GPTGLLPAGLWGQVPACDPYIMNASILTTEPLTAETFIEVQTGEPTHVRARYTPSADNRRFTLVCPSDRLRVFTPPQELVKLELLVESIGGVNELGTRMYQAYDAQLRTRDAGVRMLRITADLTLPAW